MEIVVSKRKETKVPAIGDIYQLVHKYRDFDARLCENVYFYRRNQNAATPLTSYSQTLAAEWNTTVLTPMLAGLPSNFVSYAIEVKNLFDGGDQYSLGINRAGTRSMIGNENMPTFCNAVVTMATDNGFVKKGRKSFPGLVEADNNAGILTGVGAVLAATKAALTQLAIVTGAVAGAAFDPVVVGRIKNLVTGNYELPTVVGEAIYGNIVSAVVSGIISTMNSRKV